MKAEIAKKWIVALRSGEYKQTKGELRSKRNGFCCLGVLCNLHAQAHPEIAAAQGYRDAYMGESGLLPDEVQRWAGMRTSSGHCDQGHLSEINDGGARFKTVADIIEKNVEVL